MWFGSTLLSQEHPSVTGRPPAIRTLTVTRFERAPSAVGVEARELWCGWLDSNQRSPEGRGVYSAVPLPLDDTHMAESTGVEPVRAISDACRVSSAVAYRPPRFR